MKTLSVLLVTLLTSCIVQSQETYKNIYKNFESFKKNTPNLESEFTFEMRTPKQIWGWGGTEYKINFIDKNVVTNACGESQ